MLSICISDKGLMVVDASLTKKKMTVKKFTRAISSACEMGPEGFKDYEEVRANLVQCLNDLNLKPKKALITLDSASIVFNEEQVPMRADRKIKVNLDRYMARFGAQASSYVADYRLNGKSKVEGKTMCDVSVIFVFAKVVAEITRMCESLHITPVAIDVAQNSSLKIINRCIADKSCKFDREFILLDFKSDFITLYLYKDGVKKHTVNFAMKEKLETRKYFMELKSKIDLVNEVANDLMITPTNIYITGEVMGLKWALQKLANVEDMNVNQLPIPRRVVKGMTNLEFNQFYAPVGTLMREFK